MYVFNHWTLSSTRYKNRVLFRYKTCIGELISQEKRVLKGWFPMNPKRKEHYEKLSKDKPVCPTCKDKK